MHAPPPQRPTRHVAGRSSARASADVYRRRRLGVLGAVVVVIALILYATDGGGSRSTGRSRTAGGAHAAAASLGAPHLKVSLASWQLAQPLSRTVALAVDGNIDLLGGLTGAGTATTGAVEQINSLTGASENVGSLAVPVHDAAGAAIGSRYFVFGGGASALTAASQSYSPDVASGAPTVALSGQLPGRRADLASAVAPDGTVYLAGGYDGTNFTPAVLSTRNGTTFSTVGQLTMPVRYPAVAVAGGVLYVIGGETGTSPTAGAAATDVVQVIDPRSGHVSVGGHLPVPLSHATAAVLDGAVYVFGGRSGGHVVDSVYKLSIGPAGVTAAEVGALPIPTSDMAVATLGATAYLIGGEGQLGQPTRTVTVAKMSASQASAGPAGTASAPFKGELLIADRGNDRLLLVDVQKRILWQFPSAAHPAPAEGFYFPDDAFFINHGTEIITNQEDQNTIECWPTPRAGWWPATVIPTRPGRRRAT
jgi:hypothetical protein